MAQLPLAFRCCADAVEYIDDGIVLIRAYADTASLYAEMMRVIEHSPLRYMQTRSGKRMSVAMTNCGNVGWISDRKGYRYDAIDPLCGRPWSAMPASFRLLAIRAANDAGFSGFEPDVCLINCYRPGSRLGSHQDADENNFSHPIVSVSIGLPAVFLIYGNTRSGCRHRLYLYDKDVVVLGGSSRRVYHGICTLADGDHPLTGRCRFNLTFRQAQ